MQKTVSQDYILQCPWITNNGMMTLADNSVAADVVIKLMK